MHQEKTFLLKAYHIITLLVHISSIQFADQTNQSNKHQLKSELNFIRLPKRLIMCKTTKWVYWKYNIEHLFNKYILSDGTSIHFAQLYRQYRDPGQGPKVSDSIYTDTCIHIKYKYLIHSLNTFEVCDSFLIWTSVPHRLSTSM